MCYNNKRQSIKNDLRDNPGEPSGATMEIFGIARETYEDGIEFADLESVRNALRIDADGGTLSSREVSAHGFGTGIEGVFGLTMKMAIDDRRESGFMADLLGGIDDRINEGVSYRRSYDYDGVGPFFKTTVDVSAVKVGENQLVYLLGLRAAYVGDKPCADLASSLGANRSLVCDQVVINLTSVGDRFEFDFDVAAEKLDALGFGSMTGEQIASHVMEQAQEYEGKPSVTIVKDGIAVTFGIVTYSVDGPIEYDTRELVWTQNGAVVSGPLRRSYEKGAPFATAQLFARISVPEREDGRSWMQKPIVDPTIKQRIHDLASALVAAFQ